MSLDVPPPLVDLRARPVDDVLARVERGLDVRLDREQLVVKRRSVGAPTDRGTWVRIECRPLERVLTQGWNGAEAAAVLRGVAMPSWFAGMAWRGVDGAAMWRADETELVTSEPVGRGEVRADPRLPASWWRGLNESLDALAAQPTSRRALQNGLPLTQRRITDTIRAVYPTVTDTTITQWTTAHADLGWANVTGPEFCLLDWEDWGLAPHGFDAVSLWMCSLAVPPLAERLRQERGADWATRDALLTALYHCAIITQYNAVRNPGDPWTAYARREAAWLVPALGEDR